MKGQNTLHNYGGYVELSKDCQNSKKKLHCLVSVIHYSMEEKIFLLIPFALEAFYDYYST